MGKKEAALPGLSRAVLPNVSDAVVAVPPQQVFALPEKVLQFGTGVLLRALPDYFIDKANRQGIFNGRIVVVKSTGGGTPEAFAEQGGLYTLCIRGLEAGRPVAENRICAGISRVLSAGKEWTQVLECARSKDLKLIISNTTEVGIQYVAEKLSSAAPQSFPAKLLALLHERYKKWGNAPEAGLIVLPTELISNNGEKLAAILHQLADYNALHPAFMIWMNKHITFCNTLVDCIVPGKPGAQELHGLEAAFGYSDKLLVISEAYRLWAIEGNEAVAKELSFAQADGRVIITPDITKYKELKLRMLNATHTLTCGLAHLAGIKTVHEGMQHAAISSYIKNLMTEIAPSIPAMLAPGEAHAFGHAVLDRFSNPHLAHHWLSITMQYSSKIAMRVVPLLETYMQRFGQVPQHMALGMAAYILFTRPVDIADGRFSGSYNGVSYPINDDAAAEYFELWKKGHALQVVGAALKNTQRWNADLAQLPGFEAAVKKYMQILEKDGAAAAIDAAAHARGI